MGWEENRLSVDDWGVRVNADPPDVPPSRSFAWDSIHELRAYAVEDGDGVFTVFELHHFGDDSWEEVLSSWASFPALASALTRKLPGIVPNWLERATSLRVEEGPVVIWRRSDPNPGG